MNNESVKFIAVRTLGNFLLLSGLFGVLMTFGPALFYQLRYEIILYRHINYLVVSGRNPAVRIAGSHAAIKNAVTQTPSSQNANQSLYSFATVLAGNTQQILIPVNTQFSITIPKIGASAKIYPNVDPTDPSVYLPILLKGIAQAKGSVFPGMNGNVYLFAHSTDNWWDVGRYNAVFYLLKNLTPGDSIVVFYQNRRYDYTVDQTLIKEPSDTSLLTNQQKSKQQLVLQTCWPPGTTWQRLYVLAAPEKT